MCRLRIALTFASIAAACAAPPQKTSEAPGIAFPTSLGEGSYQPENEARPRRASERDPAPAASASVPEASSTAVNEPAPSATSLTEPAPSQAAPPDPEPLRQAEQWEYEIASDAGSLSVVAVKPVNLPKPIVTARRMGRYAIELWIGQELVERVRFDLPLLGGEEPEATAEPRFPAPTLEKGAHVRARVLVPRATRARRALLIDRARDRAIPLPWPPDQAPARGPATRSKQPATEP